jgi:DNA-binding transcriptional regulator YiaG
MITCFGQKFYYLDDGKTHCWLSQFTDDAEGVIACVATESYTNSNWSIADRRRELWTKVKETNKHAHYPLKFFEVFNEFSMPAHKGGYMGIKEIILHDNGDITEREPRGEAFDWKKVMDKYVRDQVLATIHNNCMHSLMQIEQQVIDGNLMKEQRIRRGKTQGEFGDLLGIGERQVRRYENGEIKLDAGMKAKLELLIAKYPDQSPRDTH